MKNKGKIKGQFRQGDVLIQLADNVTKDKPIEREGGRVILAHGEVTGHAHAIEDAKVEQFTTRESGVTALDVQEAMAALKHEEHSTINLAPGEYKVTRQREYSPEAVRNVAD